MINFFFQLRPIPFCMKNCSFPNTTHRTLNIFTKTYAKVKGKVVNKTNMYIWVLLMKSKDWIHEQASCHLRPIIFCRKMAHFLRKNTSGLWVFDAYLSWLKNKASVYRRVWLTKTKRWAHGQTSRHLRLVKLPSKNWHFPYNTKDFKYLDEYLLCDGKEKWPEYGKHGHWCFSR